MGAGFVIDILVEYIVRAAVRLVLGMRSAGWRRGEAAVMMAKASPSFAAGCPSVWLRYRPAEPGLLEASATIPFLSHGSAEDFAATLRPGTLLAVRIDPRPGGRTLYFPVDQD